MSLTKLKICWEIYPFHISCGFRFAYLNQTFTRSVLMATSDWKHAKSFSIFVDWVHIPIYYCNQLSHGLVLNLEYVNIYFFQCLGLLTKGPISTCSSLLNWWVLIIQGKYDLYLMCMCTCVQKRIVHMCTHVVIMWMDTYLCSCVVTWITCL